MSAAPDALLEEVLQPPAPKVLKPVDGLTFVKKIMPRGMITVPSDVREAMGIKDGDIVEFEVVSVVRRRNGHVKTSNEG